MKKLQHITLDTGYCRLVPCDDVTPETIAVLESLLAKALNGPMVRVADCGWRTTAAL